MLDLGILNEFYDALFTRLKIRVTNLKGRDSEFKSVVQRNKVWGFCFAIVRGPWSSVSGGSWSSVSGLIEIIIVKSVNLLVLKAITGRVRECFRFSLRMFPGFSVVYSKIGGPWS